MTDRFATEKGLSIGTLDFPANSKLVVVGTISGSDIHSAGDLSVTGSFTQDIRFNHGGSSTIKVIIRNYPRKTVNQGEEKSFIAQTKKGSKKTIN